MLNMQNERKVPWVTLILQTLYLSIGVLFHVFIRPMFAQVFLDIELYYIPYLVLKTPLVIAVLGGVFLFFLWAWEYDRLENKFIVAFINLFPIIFIVLTYFILGTLPLIENLGT